MVFVQYTFLLVNFATPKNGPYIWFRFWGRGVVFFLAFLNYLFNNFRRWLLSFGGSIG